MAVLLADACSAGERTPYKRKQNEVKLQTSRNANYVPSIAYGASWGVYSQLLNEKDMSVNRKFSVTP